MSGVKLSGAGRSDDPTTKSRRRPPFEHKTKTPRESAHINVCTRRGGEYRRRTSVKRRGLCGGGFRREWFSKIVFRYARKPIAKSDLFAVSRPGTRGRDALRSHPSSGFLSFVPVKFEIRIDYFAKQMETADGGSTSNRKVKGRQTIYSPTSPERYGFPTGYG